MDYGKHFKDRMTQAEIDSALMAKMDADQREIARLRDIVADCRDAAGFGTEHDPMEAEGFAALGEPIEVPAFIEKQFKRLRADLAEEKLEHHHYRALAAHAEEARKQAQIDKQKAIEARNRSALDVRRDEVAPLQAKLATEKTKHHYTALAAHAEAQEVNRLNAELAAAQAREEKLRWYIQGYCTESWGAEALAIPHDDTALKERLAKERERHEGWRDAVAFYVQDHCVDGEAHAETIRAMGDE